MSKVEREAVTVPSMRPGRERNYPLVRVQDVPWIAFIMACMGVFYVLGQQSERRRYRPTPAAAPQTAPVTVRSAPVPVLLAPDPRPTVPTKAVPLDSLPVEPRPDGGGLRPVRPSAARPGVPPRPSPVLSEVVELQETDPASTPGF